MNDLQVLLQEYLMTNKKLSLPQIGTLSVRYLPARFDRTTRTLHSYRYELSMTPEVDEVNQNTLYLFLKNKFYHHESLSKENFMDFVSQIIERIKTSVFTWESVGNFKLGEHQNIVFEPETSVLERLNQSYTTPANVIPSASPSSKSAISAKAPSEWMKHPIHTLPKNTDLSTRIKDIEPQSAPITPKTRYNLDEPIRIHQRTHKTQMFVNNNKTQNIKTDFFLDTELTERYSAFQKISIIVVLIVTVLYLFFHLFLNDFSFHSYSN